MHGEEQKITLTISHDGSTIEEAIIKATVINKDNIPIYKVPGFTNSPLDSLHIVGKLRLTNIPKEHYYKTSIL